MFEIHVLAQIDEVPVVYARTANAMGVDSEAELADQV
jgi:hypothetical protein